MKRDVRPAKSSFVEEVSRAERTHWEFPPLRHFVRPVLVSTVLFIIIIGLVFGGIYAARFISENIKPGTLLPPVASIPADNQSSDQGITEANQSNGYTLSTKIVPEAGGEIRMTAPSSNGTFQPGSRVTLTAVPSGCYAFSYWDGVPETSDTITVNMDSDKSIAAVFRLKESKPPVISDLKAECNSDISATITWLTDKPATSQVDYGKTKSYGLSALSNDGPVTNHRVRMTGLEPNTMYYFSVKSADECGNEAGDTNMLLTLREITLGERAGQRALDFTLPYYHDDKPDSPNKAGKNETLSTYLGKKKILLNFWSTYCGACIGEFPYIRDIYEDENFANKNAADSEYEVLTICIDTKIDEAPDRIKTLEAKFINETGAFTFPMLFDTVAQTKKDYHVWTIPETIFIDTDGIIRVVKTERFKSVEEIETILKSLD
jgi:thiol-disulfide isomerase/thioredoxin